MKTKRKQFAVRIDQDYFAGLKELAGLFEPKTKAGYVLEYLIEKELTERGGAIEHHTFGEENTK